MGIGQPAGINKFRANLKKKFKITEILNPSVITGVQVEWDRPQKWLNLHQSAFVEKILVNHKMSDCKGVDVRGLFAP